MFGILATTVSDATGDAKIYQDDAFVLVLILVVLVLVVFLGLCVFVAFCVLFILCFSVVVSVLVVLLELSLSLPIGLCFRDGPPTGGVADACSDGVACGCAGFRCWLVCGCLFW